MSAASALALAQITRFGQTLPAPVRLTPHPIVVPIQMRPIAGLPASDRRRASCASLRTVGERPGSRRSPRRRRAVRCRPLQLLPRRGRARCTSIRPSMAVVFPGAPIGVAAVLVQAAAVRGRRPCREQDRHGCSQHCSGHLSPDLRDHSRRSYPIRKRNQHFPCQQQAAPRHASATTPVRVATRQPTAQRSPTPRRASRQPGSPARRPSVAPVTAPAPAPTPPQ